MEHADLAVRRLRRQLGAGNDLESDAAIERVGYIVFARADQIFPRAGAMRDDPTGEIASFGFQMFPYILGALQRKSFV